MAKNNKVKKTKQVDPFETGLDTEQQLADSLCEQFLKVGVDKDAIDEAFIGAFKGLSHRMLTIFKKEYVFELLQDMVEISEEEQGEHVCDDCRSEGKAPNTSDSNRNKMH
jgi:hypothetical protein